MICLSVCCSVNWTLNAGPWRIVNARKDYLRHVWKIYLEDWNWLKGNVGRYAILPRYLCLSFSLIFLLLMMNNVKF